MCERFLCFSMSAKQSSYLPSSLSLASFLSMRNHIQSASLLSCVILVLCVFICAFLCRRFLSFMLCSHRLYGTLLLHGLSACHRLPGLINAFTHVLSMSQSNGIFILPSLLLGRPSSPCFCQPGHHFPFAVIHPYMPRARR